MVSYDITERKQLRWSFKQGKRLLQSLIYNIPLEFYARDKDRKIFMQSSRSIETWGDLNGKTVDDHMIDESIKKLWK